MYTVAYKGLIMRSQLNGDCMFRTEMYWYFRFAVDRFYMGSCCVLIHCLGHTLVGTHIIYEAYDNMLISFFRISQASKVPPEAVKMNHDLVRTGLFDLKDIDHLIHRPVSQIVNTLPI